MAADLFETYAVTIVATMVLSSIFLAGVPALLEDVIVYPLAIGGVCIIASIIGTFFVRLGASQNIMGALYQGFIVSAVLSLVGIAAVTAWVIGFDTQITAGPASLPGTAPFPFAVARLVVTGP